MPEPAPERLTYYDVLGVSPNDTRKTIRAAFCARILQAHPDHNLSVEAEERTRLLNEAWKVLGDEEERRRYDAELLARSSYGELPVDSISRTSEHRERAGANSRASVNKKNSAPTESAPRGARDVRGDYGGGACPLTSRSRATPATIDWWTGGSVMAIVLLRLYTQWTPPTSPEPPRPARSAAASAASKAWDYPSLPIDSVADSSERSDAGFRPWTTAPVERAVSGLSEQEVQQLLLPDRDQAEGKQKQRDADWQERLREAQQALAHAQATHLQLANRLVELRLKLDGPRLGTSEAFQLYEQIQNTRAKLSETEREIDTHYKTIDIINGPAPQDGIPFNQSQ